MEKALKSYGETYRKVLAAAGYGDVTNRMQACQKRLKAMYESDQFRCHDVYSSADTTYICAVIAMCLELKDLGLSDEQILSALVQGFKARQDFFRRLIQLIDRLPFAYRIAETFNRADHDRRVKDGSIIYDYFRVEKGKIEYKITGCAYADMFGAYGIRSLCRFFCMIDEACYENLTRHVTFIRHSTLAEGSSCHDEIIKKGRSTTGMVPAR